MKTKASNKNQPEPRHLLLQELERRCRDNPRYSLRAFAKALEISPSALSMVLSGERGLSRALAQKISSKLALEADALRYFVQNSSKRIQKPVVLEEFNQLSLDQFSVVSEWYHFGILSLIETKDFSPELPRIASRLGISLAEAKSAVDRLVRLGLLDTSGPRWKQIGAPIFVANEQSTPATRRHQRQVMENAIHSLENDPIELRELNSVTMAIDPALVPHARKEIRKFLIRLMTDLESRGTKREVYHLNAQIIPASRNRGN